VQRSRLHGAILPLSQYAFMAWCSVKGKSKGIYIYIYTHTHTGVYPKFPDCVVNEINNNNNNNNKHSLRSDTKGYGGRNH
jgi:hypothetical protein